MVLRATDSPRKAHVQIRGDFLRPGEPVESTVPAVEALVAGHQVIWAREVILETGPNETADAGE